MDDCSHGSDFEELVKVCRKCVLRANEGMNQIQQDLEDKDKRIWKLERLLLEATQWLDSSVGICAEFVKEATKTLQKEG